MRLQLSSQRKIDVNIDPFSRIEFTFPEEGLFNYAVLDGSFVESGTVKVTSSEPPTGDEFIAILEEAVQPDDVILPIGDSLEWLNLRDHVVRLVIGKPGTDEIA